VAPPDPRVLLARATRFALADNPSETDLKRSISDAYYAAMHFLITQVCDAMYGATNRETSSYALAYRSFQHARVKRLARELIYLEADDFGRRHLLPSIAAF
jgi:hypothetical protein